MKKKKMIKKLKKKRFNYVQVFVVWLIIATLVHLTS